MRCAGSLQSLNVQRTFLGGIPPRIGNERARVEFGRMLSEDNVGSGEDDELARWRPTWVMRREEAGRDVRRERRWRRVVMEVDGGMERGMTG